jgi:PIN domain nuclease of toxin-antitoxin system
VTGDGSVAVLDASALLAFVYEERGSHRVEPALRRGALISTVNWAEALSDMAERGDPVEVWVSRVKTRVGRIGTLDLVPFDEAQAEQAARLRMPTRSLGLSLADRACLALGRLRRLPVLTTDRAWRSLHLSIKIEVIR